MKIKILLKEVDLEKLKILADSGDEEAISMYDRESSRKGLNLKNDINKIYEKLRFKFNCTPEKIAETIFSQEISFWQGRLIMDNIEAFKISYEGYEGYKIPEDIIENLFMNFFVKKTFYIRDVEMVKDMLSSLRKEENKQKLIKFLKRLVSRQIRYYKLRIYFFKKYEYNPSESDKTELVKQKEILQFLNSL